MRDPLVSVVIPTYNRAGLISETIDNVLGQSYPNLELIVVDDGSTDQTQSVLRRYGNRLRIVTQDNAGASAARNRGAAMARGEILAFQDSDDLWKTTKLERQVALLREFGLSVPCCLCNTTMRLADGKEFTSFDVSLIHPKQGDGLWINAPEVLANRFVLFNQAAAIRRDTFEKLGGFDEKLKYLEDYDLSLRLSLEGPWALIQEPLVINRVGVSHGLSQQASNNPIVIKEYELTIFKRMLALVDEGGQRANLRPHLERRLRVFRRGVEEFNKDQNSSWSSRLNGRLMSTIGHYRDAIFRRSPWFPKAITLSANPPSRLPADSKYKAMAH
jgi:glycosyltransferase involved in cell wall biosynthesis